MSTAYRLPLLALPAVFLVLFLACSSSDDTSSTKSATATPGIVQNTTPQAAVSAECAKLPTPGTPLPTPPEPKMTQYPARPAMTIDPKKKYLAHIYTETGHIIIDLRPDLAPETVNSFVFLANDKYFDGQKFHRVEPGFVIQTGDPTGTGTGGPGYTIPLEPNDLAFDPGVVGMARTNDPNSGGSQWFIMTGSAPNLNKQYTAFGKVVQGQDVADCMKKGDRIIEVLITEL